MTEPLDETYFRWLYGQVANARMKNPSRTYWSLMGQLYTKQFVWWVPNDDNRVEDGRELRHEFLNEMDILDADPNWIGLDCSILEMLIGLSRRLSFDAEGEPRDWFWFLLQNLAISKLCDRKFDRMYAKEVDETLERLNNRTYSSNGQGGLFPLRNPHEDQREVEIYYQWCHWEQENEHWEEG